MLAYGEGGEIGTARTKLLDAAFIRVLRCAGCGAGRLVAHERALECPACGRAFPIQAGIPVMISDALPERGPLLDPAVATAVMGRLGISADPIGMLRVRRASGARVRLREGALLHDGTVLDTIPGAPPPLPGPSVGTEGRLRCEWLRDYIPRAMGRGVELLANIQFRNAGQAVMRSAGPGRVALECRWGSGEGDARTALLADVAPGQIVTVALRLRTPAQAGGTTLTINLVQEGERPLGPSYGPLHVTIRDGAGFVPPPHWVLDGPGPPDRDADRRRAAGLMREWVGRLGVARPRVLELGGGVASQAALAGYDAVSVDGDLLALQLGQLAPGPAAPALCSGLTDLPLAEAAFDAIVCFGVLNYEADPAQTLRNLRAHLRPGGFIGLFCEPVGEADVVAAWRRGLNAQVFSPAEYAAILRRARLHAAAFLVDGASLQARLEPEGADA